MSNIKVSDEQHTKQFMTSLHSMLTKTAEQIVQATEMPHQLTMLMTYDEILEEVRTQINRVEKLFPELKGGE